MEVVELGNFAVVDNFGLAIVEQVDSVTKRCDYLFVAEQVQQVGLVGRTKQPHSKYKILNRDYFADAHYDK